MARDDDDVDRDEAEEDRPRKKKKKSKSEPTKDECQMAMFCHLGGLLGFILPLVIWMMKKDESRFVDRHGKEALNFAITAFAAHLVAGVLIFCTFGLLSLLVMVIVLVFSIQGAMAAQRGERYEYPVSIRLIQ